MNTAAAETSICSECRQAPARGKFPLCAQCWGRLALDWTETHEPDEED